MSLFISLILLLIEKKVFVLRSKETKEARLRVSGFGFQENWDLYSVSSSDTINKSDIILSKQGDGSYPFDISPLERKIFFFRSEELNQFTSDRILPIQGGQNFRDVGGYKTVNGTYIKWGKFIRSGTLNDLTKDDESYLISMKLKTIVDFRERIESIRAPDPRSYSKTLVSIQVKPPNKDFSIEATKEYYRTLVSNRENIEKFREFFQYVQKSEGDPIIFHCSDGIDRTGVATYLLLSALEVDEETIIQDYLLSNEEQDSEELAKIEYINAAVDYIKEHYEGDIEKYLTNELQVDLAKVRNLYLDAYSDVSEGDFDLPKVSISRNITTKLASLHIEGLNEDDVWNLSFTSKDRDDLEDHYSGKGNGDFLIDQSPTNWTLFAFKVGDKHISLAERFLPIVGKNNFRDIGGYKTETGNYVKWGKLIRSSDLYSFQKENVEYLNPIGNITILDFRTRLESIRSPDYRFSNGQNFVIQIPRSINVENYEIEAMKKYYQHLVSNEIEKFHDFFKLVQNASNIPLLYHCSDGIDRTGFVTYLLLSALGVEEKSIFDEYLLSPDEILMPFSKLKQSSESKAEYLQSVIDIINNDYENVENFLKNVVNVSFDELRRNFVEDADESYPGTSATDSLSTGVVNGDGNGHEKESSSLSGAQIALISTGSIVFVVILAVAIFFLVCHKKKNSPFSQKSDNNTETDVSS